MIITGQKLSAVGVKHGLTAAALGNMRLPEIRRKFFEKEGMDYARALFLKQVHGDKILQVHNEKDFQKYHGKIPAQADAWICSLPNTIITIQTADCVPLFLCGGAGEVCALAHCGWRGVSAELPYKTAKEIQNVAGMKKPISAFVAPHIQKCCFEIDGDTAQYFPKTAEKLKGGKFRADLAKEVRYQLISAGLAPLDIEINGECTCCAPDNRFFSFRRDKEVKGMLSFIRLS